jgi:hypothetical protein
MTGVVKGLLGFLGFLLLAGLILLIYYLVKDDEDDPTPTES